MDNNFIRLLFNCKKYKLGDFFMKLYKVKLLILLGFWGFSANSDYFGDELLQSYSLSTLSKVGAVQQQILRNTRGVPPHDPLRLAEAFVRSANKYGLDANLLAAVAFVESGYFVGAVNKRSNDFGLMQVNLYNIRAMGLSKERLLTDIEYSIDAGAQILAYFAKRYRKVEGSEWVCRYNIGTRAKKGALARICVRYSAKVRRAR